MQRTSHGIPRKIPRETPLRAGSRAIHSSAEAPGTLRRRGQTADAARLGDADPLVARAADRRRVGEMTALFIV